MLAARFIVAVDCPRKPRGILLPPHAHLSSNELAPCLLCRLCRLCWRWQLQDSRCRCRRRLGRPWLSDASRLRGGSFCAGEDRRGDVDGGECGLPVIYAYRAARGAAEEADSLHFPGASLNQLSAAFAVQQTRETAVGSAPRWTMATKSGVAKRSQNLSDHLA